VQVTSDKLQVAGCKATEVLRATCNLQAPVINPR